MKGSNSRLRAVRGSMDKESKVHELIRSLGLPRTQEDTFSITTEVTITMEGARTIIVAPRMAMGTEEATDRTVPTHQPQPRRI